MKGLTLARQYYETVGRPALAAALPDLVPRMAAGLAGEGSECFGFDDALSRDHDWGAGFCLWLEEEDWQRYGDAVQALYDSLPAAGFPVRQTQAHGAGRVGCLCTQHWYARYTGCPNGPETPAQWRRVPEAFLATAVNGAVFADPLGRFSAVRARAEFMRAGMSLVYLLNRRYAPFYKWMHRGLHGLPVLPRAYDQFAQLAASPDGAGAVEQIEGICLTAAAELRRQGLSRTTDSFLQAHAEEIMQQITDPVLRRAHIMEE